MLVRISNVARDYAWGSSTLIPQLEGRVPSGKPEAEVWFGDHPGCPAIVEDGSGQTLNEWLPAHSEAREAATPRLPFLLKLLAAGSALSIQVHPSKAQAEQGCAREDAAGIARDAAHRNYRDDNHKPELIVAVSENFEALAGLRAPADTRRLLEAFGQANAAESRVGLRVLAGRLEGSDESAVLADTVLWLLSGDVHDIVDDVVAAAADFSRAVGGAAEFAREAALVTHLALSYPGDPGIVVALLMNYVRLSQGEALFVRAGVMHAYLSGLGVELMAASDNVLRGGLTPKHVDVAELAKILDTAPTPPPLLVPQVCRAGVDVFDGGVPDFSLTRVRVSESAGASEASVAVPSVAIVLCVEGAVSVGGHEAGDDAQELSPGQAVLATPHEETISVRGTGLAFIATVGRNA